MAVEDDVAEPEPEPVPVDELELVDMTESGKRGREDEGKRGRGALGDEETTSALGRDVAHSALGAVQLRGTSRSYIHTASVSCSRRHSAHAHAPRPSTHRLLRIPSSPGPKRGRDAGAVLPSRGERASRARRRLSQPLAISPHQTRCASGGMETLRLLLFFERGHACTGTRAGRPRAHAPAVGMQTCGNIPRSPRSVPSRVAVHALLHPRCWRSCAV